MSWQRFLWVGIWPVATTQLKLYLSRNLVWCDSSPNHLNAVVQPQVLVDETPLSQFDQQKYLRVVLNSKLTWPSHVAAVHKNMACYGTAQFKLDTCARIIVEPLERFVKELMSYRPVVH